MGSALVPVPGAKSGGLMGPVRGLINSILDRRIIAPIDNAGTIKGARAFLTSEHEVHALWSPWWNWLERAMKGGIHMQSLLRRFDWETENGDEINQRRRTATYINWPDLYATALTGHMMRNSPTPNYGGLGELTESDRPLGSQTRADLFHFNVDGAGQQGSEWAPWWMNRGKQAMAYGHTWIMEETPRRRPLTRADELRGLRPYLVEWKPGQVWDWHFEDGALQYAIIRYYCREPKLTGQTFTASKVLRYYLVTRKGWDGWGQQYAGGGFWQYDDAGQPVLDPSGGEVFGNFDSLDGEIPLHLLLHQRDEGTDEYPAISRSGVAELAALAESFMNVASAADFEVWDSAKGMEYFLGVANDAFNLAMAKVAEGSRFIPVPSTQNSANPTVQQSNMAANPTSAFKERLDAKRSDAETYSALSQTAGPDASGVAREADFANTKGPVLSLFASEMQTAQNQAIYNVQRRWGVSNPSGGVIWPRKFELIKAQAAVADVFDAAVSVGAESPTLFAEGIVMLCKELGMISDAKQLKTIRDEIMSNKKVAADAAGRLADLRSAQGSGGSKKPPTNLQVLDANGKLVRTIAQNDPAAAAQ